MAHIRRYPLLSHLRAEPNQYILHFKKGQLVRSGTSLAYFFNPLSAALSQVPAEDIETTFLLSELSADLQAVAVQIALIYRISDPRKAAERVNFTIGLDTGLWIEKPLARLDAFWSQKAQPAARGYLAKVPIEVAMREGADTISEAIKAALAADAEVAALGLVCVSAQVIKISPSAELEKALQTPTREAIQQKADEATFQRRAMAVEKERAIKENELATEIELARRQEQLIQQNGANQLRAVELESAAARSKTEAEAELQRIRAEAQARDTAVKAQAEAEAQRILLEVENGGERERVAIWSQVPARVHFGLAAQEMAKNLPKIEHLNLTPDLVSESLQRLFRDMTDQ